jgi:hypothetical protein
MDVVMTATISIEVPVEHAALLRRTLALAEELQQLALSAADGTVLDACEAAVVSEGRKLQTQMLEEAVTRRIEAAEKKGRRSASARVAAAKKTAVPRNASS